jgi:ketosteroid isomerase-like protein
VHGAAIGGVSKRSEAALAREALEEVCARADVKAAEQLYSERFVDHVNGKVFRGHEGIRHSVGLYQVLFEDLVIRVEDQVSDGDKVASRFTLTGRRGGRSVSVSGLTISRFSDGKIVEDFTVTDTASLLRQLGARGTLAMALAWLRSRNRAR